MWCNVMEHVFEKIKSELKTSLSTARTIDYYLMKLDSAIYMLKDYVEEVDEKKIKDLLIYLGELFEPLACYRDIVLTQARSPRFPLLRRYYSVIEECISSLECRSFNKRLVVETPSAPPMYLKEQLFRETREEMKAIQEKPRTLLDYIKELINKIRHALRRKY